MTPELVVLILGLASLSLVKEVIRSRTKSHLGKIQADLKRDLASRIQDPAMLEKIIASKLPLKDLADWVPPGPPPRRTHLEVSVDKPVNPNSFFLFLGILCFLVGVGLGIGGYLGDYQLWLAAAIVGCVGLAFLTFSIAQPQIRALSGQKKS
jgi:hypothetical protein